MRDKEKDYRYNTENHKPGKKKKWGERSERDQGLPQQSDPCPLLYFIRFLVQFFLLSVWLFPTWDENIFLGLLHCWSDLFKCLWILIELFVNSLLSWCWFPSIVRGSFQKVQFTKIRCIFKNVHPPFSFTARSKRKACPHHLPVENILLTSLEVIFDFLTKKIKSPDNQKWKVIIFLNMLLPKFFENVKFLNNFVQKCWNVSI